MKIWFLVTEETRQKLRGHLPKNWQPPKESKRYIIVPLEETKEIDRIMRKPPMSRKVLGD